MGKKITSSSNKKPSISKNAKTKGEKASKTTIKVKKTPKRIERMLAEREPKIVENTKIVMLMKGHKTSNLIQKCLLDLNKLLAPHTKVLTKKNEILPFEDANSIEFLGSKNDCSLFALGSHNKKRPHNLILGRLYDNRLLDMIELGIDEETHQSLESVKGPSKASGAKPLIIFQGDAWNYDPTFKKIENLLLDFFRGEKISKLSLRGIDNVISFSVTEDNKIYMRGYFNKFTKSGDKTPNADLIEMGPRMNFTLRRSQFANDELMKTALRRPKETMKKKVKNVNHSAMGHTMGRIHMEKQDLDNMNSRRVTALRNGGRR